MLSQFCNGLLKVVIPTNTLRITLYDSDAKNLSAFMRLEDGCGVDVYYLLDLPGRYCL